MECPDWFDLKNYPSSSDPRYWYRQILNRLGMRAIIDSATVLEKFDSEKLKSNFKATVVGRSTFVSEEPIEADNAASFLNLGHLCKIHSWMSEPEVAESIEVVLGLDGHDIFDYETHNMLADFKEWNILDLIENNKGVDIPIVINPHADLSSILNDVETLVTELRKLNDIPLYKKPIGKKEFADWFTYAILPCWDLNLWSELSGLKMTNTQLGDTLWPQASFDRAERVRKTTKSKYGQVISSSTL